MKSSLRGKGDGTFHPVVEMPAVSPLRVVSADLNGDGLPDLVVQNTRTNPVLSIFLNQHGSFPAHTHLPATGTDAYSLNVVDIDHDAKLDIITSHPRMTYRGNGDGTFQAPTTTPSSYFLTLADFNLDGNLEPAALGQSSGCITVGSVNVWVGDYAPISIGIGDVDLDGRLDFMTSNLGQTVAP